MKTLYLDCSMGAAGDMLTAALLELLDDPADFVAELNGLGLPGVEFTAVPGEKMGIHGTHMQVLVHGAEEDDHHHHHHHHSDLASISHILSHLNVPEKVRRNAQAVYNLIAQAESRAHGVSVEQVHFHEVGALDAVADVTAVCLLMERLAPERVCASHVHLGSGTVHCAHGELPVPAPATAYLLEGVPCYGGEILGELCTPTGAALLKYYVNQFGPMPGMVPQAVGYGLGKKDFPRPNCLRAILGDAPEQVLELACNLDDMTGEEVGFAMEQLLAAGALDVWSTPVTMKKSRPGVVVTVLCHPAEREKFLKLLFHHTTTLGVRENLMHRSTLTRREEVISTPYGPVRQKVSEGFGVRQQKLEYEDLVRLAREHGMSLKELRELISR